jgi:DNA-binding response OmpR family regulator
MDYINSHLPRRVLVVDDDPDTARSWEALLRIWGYEAEAVLDGREALRAAEKRPPAAVLLDLGLPGIDGYEVARRLRMQLGEGLLLVAVTGRSQPLDRIAGLEAGIDLHFAKPADPRAVRSALQELQCRPTAVV